MVIRVLTKGLAFVAVVVTGIPPAALACPSVTVISDPDPPTNVREGPSSATSILTTVPNGQPIVIDGHRGSWVHIESPITGYISASLTLTRAVPCDDAHADSVIKEALRHRVHSQSFWDTFWKGIGALL